MGSYEVPFALPVSLDVDACLPRERVTNRISLHLIPAIA
jgi:hypothetical protein